MRLVCPNCGAQYEVPEDVIPPAGRDVQCSNCGDTWFQKHPSQDEELAEDLEQPLDDAHQQEDDTSRPEPVRDPTPEPTAQPTPEPEHEHEHEPKVEEPVSDNGSDRDNWDQSGDSLATDGEDDYWTEEPSTAPEPAPRQLSPEVQDVLRQEAAHEAEARAVETGGLESQPDLGLEEPSDEAGRRERETRLRMARMRGIPEEEALAAGAGQLHASQSRRDLLPDIEEINSTLRKSGERRVPREDPAAAKAAARQGGGFGRGFVTVIALAAILICLYVFAGKIGAAVPALDPLMQSYVAMVDQLRIFADQKMRGLMLWLDNTASSFGGEVGPGEAAPTQTIAPETN